MSSEMELEARLRALVEPAVGDVGAVVETIVFNDKQTPPSLQITVDAGQGIESLSLDEVANVSRAISAVLDATDPLPTEYLLEVSTPGAESELTSLRHYQRNLGRMIQVKLRDGEKILGRLESADETGFALDLEGTSRYVEYSSVRKARPRVSFGEERR